MRDVVVAGGGPAGLAVAIGAARAGLDVVVHDKRDGVIDKACGEGLMPGALRDLLDLGVDPSGHPITGITYRQRERTADAEFRHGPGRGVRRTELHARLRAAADRAGVELRATEIGDVRPHPNHVEVGDEQARYLVAADGLHSPLRRRLGLEGRTRSGPARWGLRRHFAVAPWTDRVEVTWSPHSEAYITPVAEDVVGVAILTSTRADFATQLAAFPELGDRLRGAEPSSSVRGAGPLRQTVRRRVEGRVLLAGDAAGYVDALTGEGLALALTTARALVDCLVRDRPQDYERAWRRASRRSRWLTEGLLWARTHAVTSGRVVPLAAATPWLFGAAVNQLAG